jgi:hypothetical protein
MVEPNFLLEVLVVALDTSAHFGDIDEITKFDFSLTLTSYNLVDVSRNLGDENRLKAAYRGGCRALPEPPETSNTPCQEIPPSFLSVSLMLSKIVSLATRWDELNTNVQASGILLLPL